MYKSLQTVCPSFRLYVIAFDDACYNYLQNADLPGLTPISLRAFEDEELLKVKHTRSAAEYCWTCTPSVILYCLQQYSLPSCTYIDADMIFYNDPHILMEEMNEKSILITEHRCTPEYEQPNGIYCVQFMYFKNDQAGMKALTWWRERCLEWCYDRLEDGKFGDQKYLDDWPRRFEGVHVLQHEGGGVAPWNVQQYEPVFENNRYAIKNKKTKELHSLVFFHFHSLKFFTDNTVSCCGSMYEIDKLIKEKIYFPYIEQLLIIENGIKQQGIHYNVSGAKTAAPSKFRVYLQYIRERLVLLKIGNISLLSLQLLNFRKHYHFYNSSLFKA